MAKIVTAKHNTTSHSPNPVLRHIGIASAIGIFLVVFGHSLPPHLTFPANDLFASISILVIDFIYTFHMPLFFSISGYLYVHTNPVSSRRSYGGLLKNKVIRLLLPYVVLGTVAFIPKIMLAEFAKNPIEPSWEFYLGSLLYPWQNSIRFFWFLPTLFAVFVLAPVLLRSLRVSGQFPARLLQITITGVLIWLNLTFEHSANPPTLFNYTGILHNMIYFWFGMLMYPLLGKWLNRQTDKPATNNLAISLALFSLSIIIHVSLSHSSYTVLAKAILGISATIMLAVALSRKQSGPGRWVDIYSYQIYLLSFFFQVPVQLVMYHYIKAPSSLVLLASLTAGLLGPLLSIYLVNRYKIPGKVVIGL